MGNNVQKMRYALGEIIALCLNRDYPVDELCEIERIAENALALPLRNCDVGTVEEQDARFVTWRYSKPIRTELGLNALEWAQMPYEADAEQEGGAK